MKSPFFGKSVTVVTLALCAASLTHAATIEWDGGAGNGAANRAWSLPANWSTDTVPSASDTAAFTDTAPNNRTQANVNEPASIFGITFSGTRSFTLGGTSTLTIGEGGITNTSSQAQTISTNINNGGFTLTIDGGSATALNGVISGSGGLTKNGAGTTTLGGANTYTGATTINAGTLTAGATNALGSTTAIQVNTNGTLLLAGTGTNRINNNASLDLNGGRLNFGGLSESETSSAGIGALTLSADSVIDFATTGTASSTLWFGSGSRTAGTLTINNWTAGGIDQLRFTSSTGLDPAFLSNVTFSGFAPGAQLVNQGGYYEMVPVPEPSTIIAGIGLVGFLGWRERRRISSLFKREQGEEALATA